MRDSAAQCGLLKGVSAFSCRVVRDRGEASCQHDVGNWVRARTRHSFHTGRQTVCIRSRPAIMAGLRSLRVVRAPPRALRPFIVRGAFCYPRNLPELAATDATSDLKRSQSAASEMAMIAASSESVPPANRTAAVISSSTSSWGSRFLPLSSCASRRSSPNSSSRFLPHAPP